MSAEAESSAENKLVQPRGEFSAVLRHAGATKDLLTMKEVMFYLGEYIMKKQLYDQKQQHIVHCAQDVLGRVMGVDSFSIKEPRLLFSMIGKNLEVVKIPDSSSSNTAGSSEVKPQEPESGSSSERRRRRSHRSSDSGTSHAADEEEEDVRKRRRSDSYSLTFDGSLSWCVIGGLGQSSDSTDERSEVAASDSDGDNFSVEFEVESMDSDDYDEDDASLSADDQVYEVTIFEAEDDDSSDEDTEITEADYWRCGKCEELNPPLPRNCLRCWTLRHDWLPDRSVEAPPTEPDSQLAAKPSSKCFSPLAEEDNDGLDVPDGKTPNSQEKPGSQPSSSSGSQPSSSSGSQPSSSSGSQPSSSQPSFSSQELQDPCLICQSEPKNGCIVHGRTGHLMCCYVCARKLYKRKKGCPVCRLPIQKVILTYFS